MISHVLQHWLASVSLFFFIWKTQICLFLINIWTCEIFSLATHKFSFLYCFVFFLILKLFGVLVSLVEMALYLQPKVYKRSSFDPYKSLKFQIHFELNQYQAVCFCLHPSPLIFTTKKTGAIPTFEPHVSMNNHNHVPSF